MPNDSKDIQIIPELSNNKQSPTNSYSQRRQIDWITIEAEYIHGSLTIDSETGTRTMHFPTADALAEKYQVNAHSIKVRCAENKWVERRELYKQKIKRQIGQERVHSLMSESSRYDAKNLILLDKIYDLLDIWLENNANVSTNENNEIRLDRNLITDLKSAMNLINQGHVLVRNIMGEPINAEKIVNELLELQTDEQKQIQKQSKNTKKKINNLLKQVEDRKDILNKLMTQKRQIEGEIKDVMTLDVDSKDSNEQ